MSGKKVCKLVTSDGTVHGCPACGNAHVFDSRWTFNGNEERPSFTPSMLVHPHEGQLLCHSYVTDGVWKYLGDCQHAMKDQSVPVPDFSW